MYMYMLVGVQEVVELARAVEPAVEPAAAAAPVFPRKPDRQSCFLYI
jgi:hypothetical protein